MMKIVLALLGGGLGAIGGIFVTYVERDRKSGSAFRARIVTCLWAILGMGMGIIVAYYTKEDFYRAFFMLGALFLLSIIFETDRRHRQIYLAPILLLALIAIGAQIQFQDHLFFERCLGMVIGGLFFGMQYMLSKGRALGLGDVWFGIVIGFLFGWSTVLFVILLAYICGSILAILLLVTKKMRRTDPFPLGSCLAAASMVALFLPSPWYWLGIR